MKPLTFILLIIVVAFTMVLLTQDGLAQHGEGMGNQIVVTNHDIGITQLAENKIHVHETITYLNPSNETNTGKITCWAMDGSFLLRFEPTVNGTDLGGNYTQLSPVIYQYSLEDNGLELGTNETILFTFEYDLTFSGTSFQLDKAFYYSNQFLVVSVYPLPDTHLSTANFILDYNEAGKYYVTHDSAPRVLGDIISIKFSPEEEEEETSSDSVLPFIAVVVLIGVILLAYQVHSRNIDLQGAITRSSKKSGAGSERSRSRNSRSGGSKRSTSKNGRSGKGNTSGRQSSSSKGTQDLQEPQPTDETLDELMEKKGKLLTAIKRLDDDHSEGLLTDDIHAELKMEYKQRAIDILKRIDDLQ